MTERHLSTEETNSLGVAEAKRRFSELIERVRAGERFVISRRGTPVIALVPPVDGLAAGPRRPPTGFAALAGALAEWNELDQVVDEIYAGRRKARDRSAPSLD